jgi:hypothetical protein
MMIESNPTRLSTGLLLAAALAVSALACNRDQPSQIDRRAYTQEHAPKQPADLANQPNLMKNDTPICTDIPDRCCTSKGFCCTFRPKLPPICG